MILWGPQCFDAYFRSLYCRTKRPHLCSLKGDFWPSMCGSNLTLLMPSDFAGEVAFSECFSRTMKLALSYKYTATALNHWQMQRGHSKLICLKWLSLSELAHLDVAQLLSKGNHLHAPPRYLHSHWSVTAWRRAELTQLSSWLSEHHSVSYCMLPCPGGSKAWRSVWKAFF